MKNLKIIVAKGSNNEIGSDNDLVWKCSEDLARFKKITMGSSLIMGKKTFDSLPGILPGREHVVLTRDRSFMNTKITIFYSLENVKKLVEINPDTNYYVIGGGQIYEQFIPMVDTMLITEVEATFPQASVFFPKFDKEAWDLELGEELIDPKTEYRYRHNIYTRILAKEGAVHEW